MFSFIYESNAQRLTEKEQFEAITEAGSELEFFVIKRDLNISREEFISKYLHILELVSNSEMRQYGRQETNDVGVTMTRYQQYVNNIKVKGADMVVNEQNGRVKYINGRYMHKTAINQDILITEEKGLQTALQQIKSTDYLWLNPEAEANYKKLKKNESATLYPHGELCYVPERGKNEANIFRLAWKYLINVSPATESFEVHINASTGEVINKIPLTYDCNGGSSTTIWNGARTIFTQLNAGSYRTLGDCNSAQVHTMNGNGNDNGVGATFYTDADNAWPNTTLGNYIAQTHWGVKETRDYYANVHSREGYDNAGHDYVSYINPGFTGNAYWTYATEAASFGGSSTGTSPYCNIDVCGHEHTHGVVHFTSDLVYQDEPGALNESFADCLGEAVEERTLGPTNWIHRHEISGGNRSLINPNDFSDPDTYNGTFWYTGTGDFGGVHTNSGVQNYWFYLLSQGGSGTNDNGHAFNVSGITIDKARLITYDCMVGLSTNSQYSNARSVSIQKAKDRYGDCANEVRQTTNAWRAVGVGAAYVEPSPLTISVLTTASDLCPGGSATITALGATTYTWSSGLGSGNPKVITPTSTTTYTVTGTNAEACTGTKSFTLFVNQSPTVTPTTNDNEICPDQSTLLVAGSNGTLSSLVTPLDGTNGSSANAFDITAVNNITITDFKMNIISGDSAEVWYKLGGYGNATITSMTGWTKLGATVPITPAGAGNLTTIPTTANLTISAGTTYGIMIACNGSNRYTNGTSVGTIIESNPDLYVREGHGGSGFGGTYNINFAPRAFNGAIEYRTNFTSYSWEPAASLSSTTGAVVTASPSSSTTYTLTATDGNGCTGTGTVKIYRYSNPLVTSISATPDVICQNATSQLNVSGFGFGSSQSLFSTLESNNGFSGNIFDIHAINQITITNVRMNISSGDSAEVWYKTTPYGNANINSSAGWIKLGNTVPITAAGAGALTLIPTSLNLIIPAGATYGVAIICNGSNRYLNGTGVGNIAFSSPDLEITEGHGGSGMGGAFSFNSSPRIFSGQIDYTAASPITSYSWSPNSGTLTSSTIANPIADPILHTTYRAIITDAHGCKDTAEKIIYVNKNPGLIPTSTPNSICPGDSAQLNISASIQQRDSLFTTLENDNGNGGNVFDIITSKPIIVRSFKMNIDSGATQAEVWYKFGGYGNASFTGTAGWTKLGATVSITPAGSTALTNIPITSSLSISSGQTVGFMIVTNGSVNYLNSTSAVGTVYSSNPYISATIGHGGSGIGSYAFSNAQRIWNGEIVYDVVNTISGYSWSPNTNMNNAFIQNPKVSPLSSTVYSVTATDINGCTNSAGVVVNVSPLPALGVATASPSSLCLGANVSLNYTAPAGSQCFGAIQSGFSGTFAPSNWTLTQSPISANGTVNTGSAPNSIILTSSNGASGSASTNYAITVPCNGYISFSWTYTTDDSGPQYDYPRYSINGGSAIIFPGMVAQLGASKTQSGVFILAVTAGQTFALQAYTSDNVGGACTITISNFKAPYQTTSGQSVVWFSAASGGSNLGNGNPQLHTPATANNFTYYAQVSSTVTGCTNTTRTATNAVLVSPIPNVTASASPSTICQGSSTTLTGSNASSYVWQPGGLSGSSVAVSPVSTTTYTVTGTSAQGCTKTSTVTVVVNSAPAITGSATPGIVCPGGAVTLTGTNAGATYNWQPGNVNSASGVGVVVNPTAQTTYTVTATYANSCTRTQTFVILMHPTPTVTTSVLPISGTICAGSNATITASSATATGYTWQPGGGVGANLIVTLANTYTVIATNAQGCTNTATRTITVNSLPTVSTTASATTICSGTSATLNALGAVSYVWNPGALSGSSVNVTPASTTTYTVIGTNANGCTNTATRTITVNTSPTITTSATATSIACGGSSTITASGGISYLWQPGGMATAAINVSPLSTTTYTVTGTAANGCTSTATRTITVTTPCGTTVNVKLYIEGYYAGGGVMTPVLQNQGVGGASSSQTDSITVELRNTTPPYAIAATQKRILNTNGTSTGTFNVTGNYYLAIKHRNALQTWSANPVNLAGGTLSYDFSNALNKAFGSNQVHLGGGVFGFYTGDVAVDENIDLADLGLIEIDISNFAFGYEETDINGDGNVDILDTPIVEDNINNFIFSIHP